MTSPTMFHMSAIYKYIITISGLFINKLDTYIYILILFYIYIYIYIYIFGMGNTPMYVCKCYICIRINRYIQIYIINIANN